MQYKRLFTAENAEKNKNIGEKAKDIGHGYTQINAEESKKRNSTTEIPGQKTPRT